MGGQGLPRAARLRSSRDFERVKRTGTRRGGRHFVVVEAPGRTPGNVSLGLAVGRSVGNAVARNRVKRRIREWFRRGRASLPPGSDWVVIARAGAVQVDTASCAAELDRLAGR